MHQPIERTAAAIREVRVYIASSFLSSKAERAGLIRDALPLLRQHCEALTVAVTFVDLRAEVNHHASCVFRNCVAL
jgi:hypothetical protein